MGESDLLQSDSAVTIFAKMKRLFYLYCSLKIVFISLSFTFIEYFWFVRGHKTFSLTKITSFTLSLPIF